MKSPDNPFDTYFIKKVTATILIFCITLILALLIWYGAHIILLIFGGALMAILYRGCAFWLGKKIKVKPQILVPIIILLHLGISVITIMLLWPRISEQIEVMSVELPKSAKTVYDQFINTNIGKVLKKQLPQGSQMLENPTELLRTIFDVFKITLTVMIDIVLIAAFAMFLVAEPDLYKKGFISLFPLSNRKRMSEIWETVNITLFKWFVGKLVDMGTIFIMTSIALWILDIPLVLTLALIAFLLSFIPNIGPVISAIPAVLIAFTKDPMDAVYVALAYLIIQLFESYYITPKVQKIAIQMPPLLLLAFQFFMAATLGVLGLFLSTPILAAIIIIVKMMYIKDVLKDPDINIKEESGK